MANRPKTLHPFRIWSPSRLRYELPDLELSGRLVKDVTGRDECESIAL